MLTLGLDMSSTCIGFALLDGDTCERYGHTDLDGNIAARCQRAAHYVGGLLVVHQPALVVIESPVARHAKAVIPQARVSGAVLAVLARHEALWQEVAPSVAKRVLCGDGAATKREMVEAARARLELSGIALERRGKWGLWMDGRLHFTEDEADAIALALCGAAMKVQTVKEAA